MYIFERINYLLLLLLLLNMKSQVVLKLDSATNSLGRIINMPKRDKTHAQLHNIE